ncbi:DUF4097 domain-containing protein [Mycobacterium sp. MYCO198283]|uniref:DUF4097 family beta strand repeat-containing protein n=1 Tax=Mycobacterium sp. MYCO198283 TaxID=2883505 RepID=UPI001E2BA453|nr:DUF4097 family beta strand repeat-containing protein [Mycobacterium sp. MYCO198283]MCG5431560.1 DUF4097 domain-containing protein [Mycobacterium sp. MYCO198283]
MSIFASPGPITARIDIAAGRIHLTASERTDTTVTVRPHNPSRPRDVKAAEEAKVRFDRDTLVVSAGTTGLGQLWTGAVDVTVELPRRSRLQASLASGSLQADGEYADTRLAAASGDCAVGAVAGALRADTASGDVTVAAVDGEVTVSTSSGDLSIADMRGELTYSTAGGHLTIEHLEGRVTAQSASGSVRIVTATAGEISTRSGSGGLDVGIADGTAGHLNVTTSSGAVTNTLDIADGPGDAERTLTVRARTGSGDIVIRRPAAAPA